MIIVTFLNQYTQRQKQEKIDRVNAQDMSVRVQYESVQPEKEVFTIGEPITVISKREVRIQTPLSFDEILLCDTYD